MSEDSGTRQDSKGSNHMSESGGTVGSGTGHIYPKAAAFDMTASPFPYLTFPGTNPSIRFANTGSFSSVGWINIDDWPTWGAPIYAIYISNRDGENPNNGWCVQNSGAPGQVVHHLGSDPTHANDQVLDTWIMWYCYYDHVNDLNHSQINLNAGDTVSSSQGSGTGGSNFAVGRAPGGDYWYFDGLMGPIAVFNRLLTSDELTWIYNSGAGRHFKEF